MLIPWVDTQSYNNIIHPKKSGQTFWGFSLTSEYPLKKTIDKCRWLFDVLSRNRYYLYTLDFLNFVHRQ